MYTHNIVVNVWTRTLETFLSQNNTHVAMATPACDTLLSSRLLCPPHHRSVILGLLHLISYILPYYILYRTEPLSFFLSGDTYSSTLVPAVLSSHPPSLPCVHPTHPVLRRQTASYSARGKREVDEAKHRNKSDNKEESEEEEKKGEWQQEGGAS
jgi:hypothetical protein